MTGSTASPPRPSTTRLPGWLLPAALLLALGLSAGGLVDDAYIFARYAGNLLDGQGLVFNPGERVEGFTSPGQVLATAGLGLAGFPDLPGAAAAVSLAAALALLVLLWRARDPDGAAGAAGPAAAMAAAAAAPLALWATSGMDAALFALAVGAAALAFDGPRGEGEEKAPALPPAGAWLLAGLAAVVRPEGAVAAVAALLLVLARPAWRRAPRAWAGLALAVLPAAAWTAFRLAYFGEWLPNTFHAKVGSGGLHLWLRGLSYLADGAFTLLPLLVAAALGARRWLRDRPFAALACAGLLAAMVLEGGDHFPAWRFWVPAIPLLALSAGGWVAATFRRTVPALVATAALAAAVAAWSGFVPGPLSGGRARADFAANVDLTATWDFTGRELRTALGPDHEVALLAIGAIPYRSGWRTLDLLGLTDPHIARVRRELGRGTPGHEKFDTDYVLARAPEQVLLLLQPLPRPIPEEDVLRNVPFEAARDLAADPRFRAGWELAWVPVRGGVVAVHRRTGPAPAAASP